jgi:hypothetical protein
VILKPIHNTYLTRFENISFHVGFLVGGEQQRVGGDTKAAEPRGTVLETNVLVNDLNDQPTPATSQLSSFLKVFAQLLVTHQ